MRKRWKEQISEPTHGDGVSFYKQKCHKLSNEVQRLKANLGKLQSHYDKQALRMRELESGLVTATESKLLAENEALRRELLQSMLDSEASRKEEG